MRRLRPRLFAILSIFFSLFIVLLIPVTLFLKPYFPFIDYLLGTQKPTSYLVLLGNDTEMRANGGFVGSYAKVVIARSETTKQSPTFVIPAQAGIHQITPHVDLSFQDIYVPDGQLQGYVTPPLPIQEAFQHGTWQLSNADWEPDFPTAATTLRWFFVKGNEINPDNLVLLNLSTIKKILDVVGTIDVPEYQAHLTPDNLYLFLQGKAETNFFPGSTQKKDALTAVGSALMTKFKKLPLTQKLRIAQILYQDLLNQNILINSTNKDFQTLLESKNFAGKLASATSDTYLLVETNLGANKANAYVTRQTDHVISFQNGQTTHQVTLKLANSSPESRPNPPFQYGGDYVAYLRFYLPNNAQNIQVASVSGSVIAKEQGDCGNLTTCHSGLDPEPISITPSSTVIARNEVTWQSIKITPTVIQKYSLTEVGFWLTTPAQNQTVTTLSYTLPTAQDKYSLTILKQHGLISSPQTIKINQKTFSTNLTNDYLLHP